MSPRSWLLQRNLSRRPRRPTDAALPSPAIHVVPESLDATERGRGARCADLGSECIYSPSTTATNVIMQKDYLQSLEGLQFLVMIGQYLHGTQKSVQAWTIHGLAARAALQLGLHSRHASQL
ncbi:hypothetical protein N7470_002907 [Penicillium chermesinum]|nr:hypothetical protein N7470_002907 [Penicillium chermesinum]